MIHPTQKHRLIPAIVVIIAVFLLAGVAQAGTCILGYSGGGITTPGVGVYPQQATGNSERYFRCIVSWAPASENCVSVQLGGSFNNINATINPQLYCRRNGVDLTATQGVAAYYSYSSGATTTCVYTIGPFAGVDPTGAPIAPNQVLGHVNGTVGQEDWQFTFSAVFQPTSGNATSASATGTYRTQISNCCILEWYGGDAAGVDPLSVDGPVAGQDFGSSSNSYTFRVQYRIPAASYGVNLLPRFGTDTGPPGPYASFADFDRGQTNAVLSGDRSYDWWMYAPGIARAPVDSSALHPRYDDYADCTGYWVGYQVPEVVLILDHDRTRPHMMMREDPTATDARAQNGIRYFFNLLPTDYANFMDNIFLFPYDPPGPDPADQYTAGLRNRSISNNYVALQSGGHTYEFIASADFSPPDGNRTWLQVARPGNSEVNDLMRPTLGGGGTMEITPDVYARFDDTNGAAGGFGYPFDSQSGQYPIVNPMLTAHPYFPRGAITPGQFEGLLTVTPAGAAPDPFAPEAGAGPNPPVRVTNDDTILPNFVNIRPDNDPTAPYRGGKWTSANTYTFRINYWQSNNVPPDFIRLMVRKAPMGPNDQPVTPVPGDWRGYTMEKADPSDSTYADGCVYRYQLTADQLPTSGGPGDYNYYFVASDGNGQVIFPSRPVALGGAFGTNLRDPADIGVPVAADGSNDFYAFRVNQPPVLSSQTVTPSSGNAGADFQFKVTYADPDGEMLKTNHLGDRPFESSIWIDLFGNYYGQAKTASIQNATTMTYTTDAAKLYPAGELVGCAVEIQAGPASGKKYTIASNTANQIVLVAGSSLLADGVTSNTRFRISKWFHGTMNAQNAADTNYTDGNTYVYNTATHVVLGQGAHRYYFEFVDDWGSWLYPNDANVRVEGERVRLPFTGEFDGPEVTVASPPYLKDYRFTPRALTGPDGTTSTPFVCSVTYVSAEDLEPAVVRVGIDGTAAAPATVLTLHPQDINDKTYHDGAIWISDPIKLTEGTHILRAQASDGFNRFPNVPSDQPFTFTGPDDPAHPGTLLDSVPGPFVAANTPPTLSFLAADNGSDPLNPPGLDPNNGQAATSFTYTVVYTDSDRFAGVAGNPPDYVHVYIDGQPFSMTKVDPNDNDYTDGAAFSYTTTLTKGTHNYYFDASDGLDRARLPKQGAVPSKFTGPVVKEPPLPAQQLQANDTPNDNGNSIDIVFNSSPDDGGGALSVTAYHIYRTDHGSAVWPALPVLSITATGAPTYAAQDKTAVTGVSYDYTVKAFDGTNESSNNPVAGPAVAIDNISPLPPSNVTATDAKLGGTINVIWNASPDDGGGQNDVKEYHVYRATTPTGFGGTPVGTVAAGLTSFADTTVADNTDYYYMVRSFDGANESIASNVAGPTQSTDQQPPIIADLYPANRAMDVPQDTHISFSVTDNGTGVDRNSLVVTATANGAPVDLGTPTITGNPGRYLVRFQPATPFDYRVVVIVTVDVADLGGQTATKTWKFTVAGPQTYSVSGSICDKDGNPKAGVVVSAGALSGTSDAAGNYIITGLTPGSYTVVPKLRGFSFSPREQTLSVDADVTGIDFTWALGFDLGGRVVDAKGNGMQGVSVTNGVVNVVTNDTGFWHMFDMPAGTYNVVPSLPRYVFEPVSRMVAVGPGLSGLGQHFVGTLETFGVAGVITDINGLRLDNATVTATSGAQTVTTTTNASGQFNLTGLLPGRWTITPSKTDYTFTPASQTVDVAAAVTEVNFVGVPVYKLSLPAGLTLLSLPLTPQDPNPLNVFGNPSVVGFWRYDPSISAYPPSNGGSPLLQVLPGRGFWVSPTVPTTLAVSGTPVARNRSVQLMLDGSGNGWNMVGNPYDAPLPWANVGVTSGSSVRDYAYIYDRSTGSYLLVTDVPGVGDLTVVPKNAGMWMRALATQSVPISPVSSVAAARHEAWTRSDGEFVVPIVAQAGSVADTCARVGVLNYAKAHPEAYEIDNPPTGDHYVDIYFTGQSGQMLTCDIRGTAATKMTYSFAVKTDLKKTVVRLSLPDLSQVSRDKSIVLVDVASGKRMYARTMNTYSYNSGDGGIREFRLEIAPTQGGGLTVTTAPAEVKGSGVGLTYTLSQPAKVDITILNLSGRNVRALATAKQNGAGVNSEAWDLRNQTGSRVPAGRYLIRITAAGEDGQQVTAVAPVTVQ